MKTKVLTLLLPLLLFYAILEVGAEKEERNLDNEMIYAILIDRFFDGNVQNNLDANVENPTTFNGGDIEGVTKKLDYIQKMGHTTIVLSPIFENMPDGYHGFWIKDFYKVDEHFGTREDLKKLVAEAHKRDMKVIVDVVLNYVGPNHPWKTDVEKQDWLNASTNEGIELNLSHSDVQTYLVEVLKWWVKETDIDGYRIYHAEDISPVFLSEIVEAVKEEKSTAYMIADLGLDRADRRTFIESTGVDAVMDHQRNESLRTAFASPNESLQKVMEHQVDSNFVTFMDTAESSRFTFNAAEKNQHPGTRWKLALSYLYTTPGIPAIFYGTEIALNGDYAPNTHQLMNFNVDQELADYIGKLAELRQSHPALIHGEMEVLYEENGFILYKRSLQDDVYLIALNNTTETKTYVLDETKLEGDKELRGLLNSDLVRSKDHTYTIVIDREMAEVYSLEKKTSLNLPYFLVMFIVLSLFIVFIIAIVKRSKQKRE